MILSCLYDAKKQNGFLNCFNYAFARFLFLGKTSLRQIKLLK